MGSYGSISVAVCHFDGIQCFGQRTYLVYFNQYGVGTAFFDAHCKEVHIGDEQIVSYQLATVADTVGQFFPAVPVVLAHAVFDRVDGILVD